mgnify:FL=1
MKKEGHYELFESGGGHQILTLDQERWFALITGQKSDLLIGSDADHKKRHTIREGKYYYADFEDDPEFRDVPHLFMKDGDIFREYVLPNGFPRSKGDQVRLVRTGMELPPEKVLEHVKGSGSQGSEKKYRNKAEAFRSMPKQELYEMARKKGIEGRSNMSKEQLVKAIEKAEKKGMKQH